MEGYLTGLLCRRSGSSRVRVYHLPRGLSTCGVRERAVSTAFPRASVLNKLASMTTALPPPLSPRIQEPLSAVVLTALPGIMRRHMLHNAGGLKKVSTEVFSELLSRTEVFCRYHRAHRSPFAYSRTPLMDPMCGTAFNTQSKTNSIMARQLQGTKGPRSPPTRFAMDVSL